MNRYIVPLLVLVFAGTNISLAAPTGLLAQRRPAPNTKPQTRQGGNSAKPTSKWRKFVSKDGRFSVDMPGTPSKRVQTNPLQISWELLDKQPRVAYVVSYADNSTFARSPAKDILQQQVEGALAVSQGQLLGQRSLKLQGHPGVEFTIQDPRQFTVLMRAYLVKTRLYMLHVSTDPSLTTSKDVARFLSSFAISR
jgi:hypothetical protein